MPYNAGNTIPRIQMILNANPDLHTPAAAAAQADFRADLRRDKRVVVVDDNQDALRFASSILEQGRFKAPRLISDSEQALREIPGLISSGEADLLIVDMAMPRLNGPQLLSGLARHHTFTPTVILSGGQGSRETRRLLSAVAAAKNLEEVRTISASNLAHTGGVALTYVAKEDAAMEPELLLAACDAMLTSKEAARPTEELLNRAASLPISYNFAPLSDREQLAADLADLGLRWHRCHQDFLQALDTVFCLLPEKTDANAALERLKSRFADPQQMSYERALVIKDPAEWDHFRHGILGSRGIHGIYGDSYFLRELFNDAALTTLINSHKEKAAAFVKSFKALEQRLVMEATGFEQVDVSELVKRISEEKHVSINFEGNARVWMECQPNLSKRLRMALCEILSDAAREARAGNPPGLVSVSADYRALSESPGEFQPTSGALALIKMHY